MNTSYLLCFVCALGGPVVAQTLPALNLERSSNGNVLITWPYTNSAFVLEQSSAPVSTWAHSDLAPAFDSNSALFSVAAPANNSTEFFRLAQGDLRGIYVYSGDVSQISSNYANSLTNVLKQPGVDGLVLVIGWSTLEPAYGQYNWRNLDGWMDEAAALGKKIDLAITAGKDIPPWVFQPVTNGGASARPLQFTVSPHQGATTNCIPETIAAPWDPNFLAAWNSMLMKVSTHLRTAGTYSNLTLLRLTGINRTTDELRLPAETPTGTGLDCVSNAPAIWQLAGYTPSNLLYGWSNILNSFAQNFPDKSFSVAIIPNAANSFPPIDDNGQFITNNIPDPNQPLLALAGQKFTGRLVVQFNFLMTGQNASMAIVQAARIYGSLPAFQSNNYYGSSGGGAACGGTPNMPVPCNNDTYLQELEEGIYPLSRTNSLRSQYIEVFPSDVRAFTNAIWQAHTELLAGP